MYRSGPPPGIEARRFTSSNYPPLFFVKNDIYTAIDKPLVEFQENNRPIIRSLEDSWIDENTDKELLTGSFAPARTTFEEWLGEAYNPHV
jgi:hypothetical protein